MYLSAVALFILSHIASVHAQTPTDGFDVLSSPASGSTFEVGSILPIVWAPESSTGTVSIELNGGASAGTLQHLFTIGTSINSQAGGYNWTITSAVGSFATYGLNLTLDGNPITEFQESYPFHLTGGSDSSSSSTSSSVSSSASTSSSSEITVSGSTVTASTTTASTTASSANLVTPSATGPTTSTTSSASAGLTTVVSTSTSASNSTASKTSSSKSSGTSSAASTTGSTTTSAANGGAVQFLSASVALLSVCLFAFAL